MLRRFVKGCGGIVLWALLSSCAGTPPTAGATDQRPKAIVLVSQSSAPVPAAPQNQNSSNTVVPVAAPSNSADVLKSMDEAIRASQDAFDTNHPVEAIRHLVGIIALDEETPPETDGARKAQRLEYVRRADAKITDIGARFTLEPGDDWVVNGKQIAGNVRELAKGTGIMPQVRLVVNYDFGKAVVADAPIRFAFVDGIGDVTTSATTDSYGLASAVVRRVARTDRPAVIRAMLVVTNRGKSRSFPEVSRDFSYVLPGRTARVFTLEKPSVPTSEFKDLSSGTALADAVVRGLHATGLDLLPTDAALEPSVFASAIQGDSNAIQRALSLGGPGASYLVLGVTEFDEPRQMVVQGKAYNIFTATGRVQLRILRSDGSAAVTRPAISVKGQGGTASAAVQSALEAARQAIEKDLSVSSQAISSALD